MKNIIDFKNFKINESWEDDYSDFLGDFQEALRDFSPKINLDNSFDIAQYYHDKGWLHDMWNDGLSPEEAIQNLKEKDDDGSYSLKYFK